MTTVTSNSVIQAQQANIQRRASQGSNNSASTNSSSITNGVNGIYAQVFLHIKLVYFIHIHKSLLNLKIY